MVIYSGTLMKKPLVVEESDSEEEEEESRNETEAESEGEWSSQGAGLNLIHHETEIDQIKEEIESESEISESEQDAMLSKPKLNHSKVKNILPTAMQPAYTSSTSGKEDEDDDDDMDDYFGSDDSDSNETEDDEKGKTESGSSGLANVMAKILATKKSENVILSKAKKDWIIKKELDDSAEDRFEVVDSSGQVKKEPQIKVEEEKDQVQDSVHDREVKRRIWGKRFRVKPNIKEDHEKERQLRVLATQGVVQLFGAIEKHRNTVQKKLSETRSVMGREKVLETTGKEAFMEMLREQGKKVKSSQEGIEVKPEMKEEIDLPIPKKPKWNVFADNFYKEPTLQGWDQQSDED